MIKYNDYKHHCGKKFRDASSKISDKLSGSKVRKVYTQLHRLEQWLPTPEGWKAELLYTETVYLSADSHPTRY